MSRDSVQKRLAKDKPPRVHIEYEVDTNGAIEKRELAFVVGVMGDYSGQPVEPLPKLKERKFVNIDGDNFDSVLKGMKPRLMYQVDNKLAKDGSRIPVELCFNGIGDFEPAAVARQVEPLRKLLEAREKLSDLRNKMFSSEKLETALADILKNTEKRQALGREVGRGENQE